MSFDDEWFATPDLRGHHVQLTALTPAHASALLAIADDDTFAHLTFARPRTAAEADQYVASYLDRRASRMVFPWVQIDIRTGAVAGMTAFYDVAPLHRSIAIGHTWLGSDFQRTGLNIEAKLLLLQRAFDELGAVRVVLHTDVRNLRSQTAIERLGAVREGILRKHRLRPDGTWRDTVQYAIVDDDWPAVRAGLASRLSRHGWPSLAG